MILVFPVGVTDGWDICNGLVSLGRRNPFDFESSPIFRGRWSQDNGLVSPEGDTLGLLLARTCLLKLTERDSLHLWRFLTATGEFTLAHIPECFLLCWIFWTLQEIRIPETLLPFLFYMQHPAYLHSIPDVIGCEHDPRCTQFELMSGRLFKDCLSVVSYRTHGM